jgi:hypothetical protein
MLKQYGEKIPPRYWPRTMFTTSMSLMNSVISIREQNKYHQQLESIQIDSPIFIIGHYRSGTTHLWKLITQDERFIFPYVTDSIFPNTLLTFQNVARKLAQWFGPDTRPQDDIKQSANSPLEEEFGICASTFLSIQLSRYFPEYRDHFKYLLTMRDATAQERALWKDALRLFAKKLMYMKGTDDSTILFKAPTITAKIDLVLEAFPNARFIHIYRNPYRVFKSTVKMEKDTLPLCSFQSFHLENLEQYILWRYREMYEAFFATKPLIPEGHFTQIAYEDLVKDRAGAVERIYHDLNLTSFEGLKPRLQRYINAISDYETNDYDDLSTDKKREIVDAWRPCFEAFAYPTGVDRKLKKAL